MQLDTLTIASVIGAIVMLETILKYFIKGYKITKKYEKIIELTQTNTSDIQNQKCVQGALACGVKALLKNELKQYHTEYVQRSSIQSDEFENFETIYTAYHNLGGNGTGTKYWEDIQSLPIVD